MDFEAITHRFLYPFYIIGMSPCNFRVSTSTSSRSDGNAETASSFGMWKTRLFQYLPTFIYLALTVTVCIVCAHEQSRFQHFEETVDAVLTYLLIFSECIVNLTVIGQTICFRRHFRYLCRKYVTFENYIHLRTKRSVQFWKFQNTFCWLAVLLLSSSVITWTVRKSIHSVVANTSLENGLLVSQSVAVVVNLHIIIHVELLDFFYVNVNDWLKSQVQLFTVPRVFDGHNAIVTQTCTGYTHVRHIKCIHFQLWDISRHINTIFGWSIVAVVIRNWVEVAYSVYWIYLYWILNGNRWFLLRTYKNVCVLSVAFYQSKRWRRTGTRVLVIFLMSK